MQENPFELLPDWCNEDFDIQLARNVDEYEERNQFVSVSDGDIDKILADSHSSNTKRNTKWVVKLFEGENNEYDQQTK